MIATADNLAGFWEGVSLAEYHADRCADSHSTLEAFRESASTYNQRYNLGTLPRTDSTPAMQLGTALHVWVLERERFADLVAVKPDMDRRTKVGQAEWIKFQAAAANKVWITQDQYESIQAMATALAASPVAGPLLRAKGRSEQAIRWDESGIWLKACFDRLLDSGIDLNLKTALNPTPAEWARQALSLGYHRQHALYRAGKRAVIGDDESLHVVVGTAPPHLVAVYELGPAETALGDTENAATLQRLAHCRESGDWSDTWENEITTISYPRYAFSER